jgi:hypothetical protein
LKIKLSDASALSRTIVLDRCLCRTQAIFVRTSESMDLYPQRAHTLRDARCACISRVDLSISLYPSRRSLTHSHNGQVSLSTR